MELGFTKRFVQAAFVKTILTKLYFIDGISKN